MDVVGTLKFQNKKLDIYSDLDRPMFKASDVAKLIEYSESNVSKMLELVESDEVFIVPMDISGQTHHVTFLNENGLYNVLSQSRKMLARKWRRVVHNELINLRKRRNYDILEQFQDWDWAASTIYFDEETGKIMQSITLPGGDVDQVEVTEWDKIFAS